MSFLLCIGFHMAYLQVVSITVIMVSLHDIMDTVGSFYPVGLARGRNIMRWMLFLKGLLKDVYFYKWCCTLMLKKVKDGHKLYETWIVEFVIGLRSFKKAWHSLGLARKADPYAHKIILECIYHKAFYTWLIYMYMFDLYSQQITEIQQRLCLSTAYLKVFSWPLDCN